MIMKKEGYTMKKTAKTLATWLAIAAMLLSLCACGTQGNSGKGNDETTVWSFYTAYGPEDGACCEIWQQLFDKIYEETDGRLKIEIYWYGQHPYEGEEMLKVVKDGSYATGKFLKLVKRPIPDYK